MLDLNYVRENLDEVRAKLQSRGVRPESLNDFEQADAERRRIISESDQLNAQRNTASREIVALMKDGKRDEAPLAKHQRFLSSVFEAINSLTLAPQSG